MGSTCIYIFEKKQRRKKGGEETRENCEEFEGKGQGTTVREKIIRCYKSGVGDCLCATAYVLIELCC